MAGRLIILLTVAVALGACRSPVEPPALQVQTFDALAPFGIVSPPRGPTEEELKSMFAEMGVEWPEGSYIRFEPPGRLVVRNTRENLDRLKRLLNRSGTTAQVFDVEVQIVEFEHERVASLARLGMIEPTDLARLRREGMGRLLAAPRLSTLGGREALLTSVNECLYPDGLRCAGAGHGSVTNEAAGRRSVCSRLAAPADFTVREIGTRFSLSASILPNASAIGLDLNVEHAGDFTWEEHPIHSVTDVGLEQTSAISLPSRHVYASCASFMIADRVNMVFGGGVPTRNGAGLVYMFVACRVVEPDGARDGGEDEAGRVERNESLSDPTRIRRCELTLVSDYLERVDRLKRSRDHGGNVTPMTGDGINAFLMSLLTNGGVNLRDDLSINFCPSVGKVVVVNASAEQMEQIRERLHEARLLPSQLEAEAQVHEFDATEVSRLSRQGDGLSDGLLRLRREGRSRLLAAPRVVVREIAGSGIKGLTDCDRVASPGSLPATDKPAGDEPAPGESCGSGCGDRSGLFDSEKKGIEFHVGLYVGGDVPHIYVPLNLSRDIHGEEPNRGSAKEATAFTDRYAIERLVQVPDGGTVLLGDGVPSRDGKKVVYTFVSARLIDLEGKPLKKPQ